MKILYFAAVFIWLMSNTVGAMSANDTYYGEQWALKNDGKFNIEALPEGIDYYIDPFAGTSEITAPMRKQQDRDSGSIHITLSAANVDASWGRIKRGIDINAENAWDMLDKPHDVIVAVIDSGVYYDHVDLVENMWINTHEIPNNGIDDDNNGYVDDIYGWNFTNNTNQIYENHKDNHGTHCAGIIAAVKDNMRGIAGIAGDGNVKIMSLKTVNESGENVSEEAVVRAIEYAEQNGARVCNMSITSEQYSEAIYRAISESDMLFVAAAGNGANWTANGTNNDERPFYPSSFDCDNIISVANMQYDGYLSRTSNYGENTVDIAAPGTYILSTTSNDTYSLMSGTSSAAPMVTGTAALLFSQNPELGAVQVKEAILAGAKKRASLNGYVSTGAMLDAQGALKRMQLPSESGFSDIKYSWAKEYIEQVTQTGIFEGTSETKFSPNKAMTRAMMAQILYRLNGEPKAEVYGGFSDVGEDKWYGQAVSWAYENNIMQGYGNGKFGAEDRLSREQLCKIMYMYTDLKQGGCVLDIYEDNQKISQWAKESVAWAVGNGYLRCTHNRVRPTASATRADAAAMLAKILEIDKNRQ